MVAYADTLDLVDRLGPAPLVAVGRRWVWPLRGPLLLPRPACMLRVLTVRHIDGSLAAMERRYQRAAALGSAPPPEALAVAAFRASLPPIAWRLRLLGIVLLTLVVARVLGTLLPRVEFLPGLPRQEGVTDLFNSTFGAFQPSTASVSAALDAVLTASRAELMAFGLVVAVAAYIVCRPILGGMRLKRMLFNVHPASADDLRRVPASWSVSRSVGIYDLERDTLRALGARPRREVPFDLLVSLAVTVAITGVYVVAGISFGVEDLGLIAGVAFSLAIYAAPGAIRVAWLVSAWRARRGRGSGRGMIAEEIEVPWQRQTVRRRSPLLIGFAAYGLFYFIPVLWWHSAMRELRDFGRAHDSPELARIVPARAALGLAAYVFVLPPLITLASAAGRVRRAQLAIGLDRPLSKRVVVFIPLLPLYCGLLQRELNRLWDASAYASTK